MEMAKKLALLVATCTCEGARALSMCNIDESGFSACKPSVNKPNPVAPSITGLLQALSRANLICLCSYRKSFLLPYLGIDPDLAIALPSKCNLTATPPNCEGL